jgi:hypothetical protein
MSSSGPSPEALVERWGGKEIRGCPGRFVLTGCRPETTPRELVGPAVEIHYYHVAAAPDQVFVAELTGGGLISYQHPDGTFLHTANDTDGFRRKIAALGIKAEP